jgi:hypothetical protein
MEFIVILIFVNVLVVQISILINLITKSNLIKILIKKINAIVIQDVKIIIVIALQMTLNVELIVIVILKHVVI